MGELTPAKEKVMIAKDATKRASFCSMMMMNAQGRPKSSPVGAIHSLPFLSVSQPVTGVESKAGRAAATKTSPTFAGFRSQMAARWRGIVGSCTE